jgi:drug/metabolite transporter (DMT)-like permease
VKAPDLLELVALAAIWGASFLFMRLAAPEFGPLALTALRVAGAALFLLPLLALRGGHDALLTHWKPLAVVGLANSAVPFTLFNVAALAINAGLSAILNSTAPLWAAAIAALWLGERLAPARITGLAIGFAGVLFLAWDKASFQPGEHGVSAGVAIAACLAATLCYGFAANYTKRALTGVSPLAVAAGSQFAAALALALPALWAWPKVRPDAGSWWALAALALLCTGVAYLLYFRLIARLGPSRAISVTFLIPVFGLLWGALFLGESLTGATLLGCAVVLVGTALATGAVTPRRQGPESAR